MKYYDLINFIQILFRETIVNPIYSFSQFVDRYHGSALKYRILSSLLSIAVNTIAIWVLKLSMNLSDVVTRLIQIRTRELEAELRELKDAVQGS